MPSVFPSTVEPDVLSNVVAIVVCCPSAFSKMSVRLISLNATFPVFSIVIL